MTAVIIEDEIPAGKRLEKLLKEKNFEVLNILHSVKEAVNWLKTNQHPDLVFMDIKLRDDLCFRIFEKTDINSKIVFTTAFDEYALKAFDYNSLDYLLKPIDQRKLDKLIAKIDRFQSVFHTNKYWKKLENSFDLDYRNSFLVFAGTALKKITIEEIVCFYSENNSSFLITKDNRQYLINQSLEKLESQLNPNLFFRISRKCIIHKMYIHEMVHSKVVVNVAIESFDLKISNSKLKSFLEFYKN